MPRLTPTRTLIALALLGLAATTAVLLGSGPTHAEDSAQAEGPRPALTVATTQPQRGNVTQRLSANGDVAAWQEASIGAEVSGLRLTDVRVNVGDTVRAGQVLATFAPETIEADVAQARASLLEARAAQAEAQANADRANTLSASGALSQQQIQQYATGAQTAQARVAVARALLQAQELRLQHTQVRAPDSGVISARTATVGAVLGTGTELFRMVRKGRLEWRAEVTATELARIQPGAKARITGASGTTIEGTVRMVAPTVDPQTRNALVYVDLPPTTDFRAGMFARGEFALGSTDALTIPQEALVVRDGFSYVFVLGPQQRVQQRKVQTGRRIADRVEILSGLEADASIAVRGAGFLNDGDLVRVSPAPAATSGLEKFKENRALALTSKAQTALI